MTCPPEEFVPGSGDGTAGNYLTPSQIASASSTPHMFSGKNLVDPLLVISSEKHGPITNNTSLDHYATLKAIQQMWHLGCLANTCDIHNTAQFMNLFDASQDRRWGNENSSESRGWRRHYPPRSMNYG